MGIWADFLDFLWPVAAKKAEPEPTFDARAADWRRALRQSVDEMMAEHRAKADEAAVQALPTGVVRISGDTFRLSKSTAYEVKPDPTWQPWPRPQFDPNAEGKLRRITGSRGVEEPRRGRHVSCVAVKTPAGEFASMGEAAKANGVSVASVSRYIAIGRKGWRRAGKISRAPRVVIDPAGVRHASMQAAARAHGMAPATLWDMLTEGRGEIGRAHV